MNAIILGFCFCCFLVGGSSEFNHMLEKNNLTLSFSVLPTYNYAKKFTFNPVFTNLVEEAFTKELHNVFAPDDGHVRELTSLEKKIHSAYKASSKTNRWTCTFKRAVEEHQIFGEEKRPVSQLIPISLARILKAERININELVGKELPLEWTRNSDNVSKVFTMMLNRVVTVEKENMYPSLAWLVFKYVETFPGKCKILLETSEEENVLMRIEQPINPLKRKGSVNTDDDSGVEDVPSDNILNTNTIVTSTNNNLATENDQVPIKEEKSRDKKRLKTTNGPNTTHYLNFPASAHIPKESSVTTLPNSNLTYRSAVAPTAPPAINTISLNDRNRSNSNADMQSPAASYQNWGNPVTSCRLPSFQELVNSISRQTPPPFPYYINSSVSTPTD